MGLISKSFRDNLKIKLANNLVKYIQKRRNKKGNQWYIGTDDVAKIISRIVDTAIAYFDKNYFKLYYVNPTFEQNKGMKATLEKIPDHILDEIIMKNDIDYDFMGPKGWDKHHKIGAIISRYRTLYKIIKDTHSDWDRLREDIFEN